MRFRTMMLITKTTREIIEVEIEHDEHASDAQIAAEATVASDAKNAYYDWTKLPAEYATQRLAARPAPDYEIIDAPATAKES